MDPYARRQQTLLNKISLNRIDLPLLVVVKLWLELFAG